MTATRLAGAAAAILLVGGSGCVYFNTFYNAEQAFAEGERLAGDAPPGSDLPSAAQAAYRKSVEKSSRVLAEHGESGWADDALLLLAKAHYRLGNHAESSAALRALLRDHPDSGLRREAMLWMTRVGREAGDYAAARGVAEDLLAAGELSDDDRVAVELELAQTALAAGDPDRALAIYDALRRDAPRLAADHGVDLLAARARLARGDAQGALGDLRAMVAAEGDPERRREAAFTVAEALMAEGRREEGLEAYRELLEAGVSDSAGAAIRLTLAEAHEADGDAAAASEELGAAARLVPSTPLAARALYRRGLLEWRQMSRRNEAKDTFVEAYLQDPEGEIADSALAAARTIAEIQHYEAIRAGRERVLAPVAPEEVHATATYLLAELVYAQEGDEDAARALFEEILAEHPGSAWRPKVLYTLGWLAQGSGASGRDEALERYAAIERDHADTEYARYAAARRAEILGTASDSAAAYAAGGPFAVDSPGGPEAPALVNEARAPASGTGTAVIADTLPLTGDVAGASPGGIASTVAGDADGAPAGDVAAAPAEVAGEPGEPGEPAEPGLLPLPRGGGSPSADPPTGARNERPALAASSAAAAAAPRAGNLDTAALAEAGATRDEVLLLLSRALPRPPDPLVGLEDRLGARRGAGEERGLTPGEIERRRERAAQADSTAGPAGAADPGAEAGGVPGPQDDPFGDLGGPGDGPTGGDGGPGDRPAE